MTLSVLALVLPASGQQIKITSFDAPGADTSPGDYNGTFASGINDRGAITGAYVDANNVYHGFLRVHDGRFATLDAPGADTTPNSFNGTNPNSINDLGEITGNYWDVSGVSHGFLRKPDGTFTTFDLPNSTSTTPVALNWEGAVVGYYTDQNSCFTLSYAVPAAPLHVGWSGRV